jgi:hypothetical protein
VLATIPLAVRIAAALAGFIAFLLARRSVVAGVVVGELVLLVSPLVMGR